MFQFVTPLYDIGETVILATQYPEAGIITNRDLAGDKLVYTISMFDEKIDHGESDDLQEVVYHIQMFNRGLVPANIDQIVSLDFRPLRGRWQEYVCSMESSCVVNLVKVLHQLNCVCNL